MKVGLIIFDAENFNQISTNFFKEFIVVHNAS